MPRPIVGARRVCYDPRMTTMIPPATPSGQMPAAPAMIGAGDLVVMNGLSAKEPIRIDLVYAQPHHPENIFGCAIYRPDAPFILHKDLAAVTVAAARDLYVRHGYISVLMDGLRPVEAQTAMQETDIAKRNPHWFEEPRLLSPPGRGGHPRGMAVDIVLVKQDGTRVDMGTPFDYLSEDRAHNPAARAYTNFPPEILENRRVLKDAMVRAAAGLGLPLLPLPSEWWDFRFPAETYNRFAPLHDAELPPEFRMSAG